ncbi:uncharacterized protein LOC125037740 [Penaeus chinensis]|uniref:uncharacterized protein LOC125037740 n=1 Tax=Penaeus chinensis TaxID=139456 RepID=UPI001FB5728D|nr:uncharacterized protein LOC125037740 [Penaeus chinensis]
MAISAMWFPISCRRGDEIVAVVWAMMKCKYYLLGLPHFTLMTDHRPLVPILNSYTLDTIDNPLLQRLKEKIASYVFTATWRKGKELVIPDALSRAPVDSPSPEDIALGDDTRHYVRCVVTQRMATLSAVSGTIQTSDLVLDKMRAAAIWTLTYSHIGRNRTICTTMRTSSFWDPAL